MASIAVISTGQIRLQPLLVALEGAGHVLVHLDMDEIAFDRLRRDEFDLVLLGWHLDDLACIRYFGLLRRETRLPLVVLTSSYDEAQTVATLRAGADACISLPISTSELVARVAAQLRRYEIWSHDESIVHGPIETDVTSNAVMVEGRAIELSAIERRLLERLREDSGVVVTRDDLCDHVWGTDGDARYTNLSLVVYNLRKKLERNPHHPRYILTKWGVGYYLAQELGQHR